MIHILMKNDITISNTIIICKTKHVIWYLNYDIHHLILFYKMTNAYYPLLEYALSIITRTCNLK